MKSNQYIKYFLLLLFVFCFYNYTHCQNPIWKFARTGSEASILELKTDTTGNLYAAGEFYTASFEYQDKSVIGITGNESSNLVVLKTEPTGKLNWMHSIHGNLLGTSVNFEKMAVSERGEMIVAFSIRNATQVIIDKYRATADPGLGSLFVAKFSKTGLLVWVKNFYSVGLASPSVSVGDMIIEEDGTSIIVGGFTGTSAYFGSQTVNGIGDYPIMYITKINAKGDIQWAGSCSNPVGPSGQIYATKVKISGSGTILVAGTFSDYIQFSFGTDSIYSDMSTNTFIAGFSQAGVSLWGRYITGGLNEYPVDILVSGKADVYLAGYSNSNPMNISNHSEDNSGSGFDTYILHLNESGGYLGHTTLSTQFPYPGLSKTILNTDYEGNILMGTEFNSPQIFSNTATVSNTEPGSSDVVFAKLNGSTFEILWKLHGSGVGDNYLDNTFIDKSGNISMTGNMSKSTSFEGTNLTGDSDNPIPYLIRINNKGTVDYSFQKNNSVNNYIYNQKTTGDIFGNTIIIGSFSGADNTIGDHLLVRPSNSGIFLAKYAFTKNICGHVYDLLGEPMNEGYVKIFGYTYYQKSPLNDSISIGADGSYCFNDLPFGRYIICAIAQREFENQYVTTYYPSEINWQFAEKLNIDLNVGTTEYDITMVNRSLFSGNSGMTGYLQQADSNNIYKSAKSANWKPAKRATVVLASKRQLKSTDDFYAETLSDLDGNYEFHNVPEGTYLNWVEIPGLPSEEYIINVIDGVFYGSVDFLIDEENIYKSGIPVSAPIQVITENNNWVYPIPAYHSIHVEVDKIEENVSLKIMDLKGSVVMNTNVSGGINLINISQLAPGSYFIQMTTTGSTKIQKISIIH